MEVNVFEDVPSSLLKALVEYLVVYFVYLALMWKSSGFVYIIYVVLVDVIIIVIVTDTNFICLVDILIFSLFFSSDDLNGAMEEFERICKEYKVTSWKHELTQRFIKLEDTEK